MKMTLAFSLTKLVPSIWALDSFLHIFKTQISGEDKKKKTMMMDELYSLKKPFNFIINFKFSKLFSLWGVFEKTALNIIFIKVHLQVWK